MVPLPCENSAATPRKKKAANRVHIGTPLASQYTRNPPGRPTPAGDCFVRRSATASPHACCRRAFCTDSHSRDIDAQSMAAFGTPCTPLKSGCSFLGPDRDLVIPVGKATLAAPSSRHHDPGRDTVLLRCSFMQFC